MEFNPADMFTIYEYNENEYKILNGTFEELAEHLSPQSDDKVQWIDVDNNHPEIVEKLSTHYQLHPLTVEDIIKTVYLPKFEEFDNYFFMSLKMMKLNSNNFIEYEHISIILGKNYIITFQQYPGDVFDDIRSRIVNFKGYIRKRKADYLFARIFNAIVEAYSLTLEHNRGHIEVIEDNILNRKSMRRQVITEILHIKKELNRIRSFIFPLRETLIRIKSESLRFFNKSTFAYLNDIQDQINFQVSSFDTFREMLKDLMDLHNTQSNQEMNHIMKTLTVISAIFIPLTFIVGWYGMNFKHMPEFDWQWSYPILSIFMTTLSITMVIFMKRKKWF